MNKYIKLLIETYFGDTPNINYSKSYIHSHAMPFDTYIHAELYNNELYEHLLFEHYHTVGIFYDAIEDIVSIYNDNKNKIEQEIYTDWNYSVSNKTCKKLNNKDIDIPIYIICAANKSTVYAALQDNTDKIVIELNKATIESSDDAQKNKNFLRECLMHELFHAREMFALPDKNILKSKKNINMSGNEKNVFKWDYNNKYRDLSVFICNTLTDSEIRARLNAVDYKLNHISIDKLKQYDNRKKIN